MSLSKPLPTAPGMLEMSFDPTTFGNNRNLYLRHMRSTSAHLSQLDNYRYVASLLLKKPGTKFVYDPAPVLGADVSEEDLPEYKKNHVKYRLEAKAQLRSLHSYIWGFLGPATTGKLKAHALVLDNDLHLPSSEQVHTLLKALFLVCTTQDGVSEARMKVMAMRDFVTVKQEGDEPLAEFLDRLESLVETLKDHGYAISDEEMTLAAIEGLNHKLTSHKSAILHAATVSTTGLPKTFSALNESIQKIDANLVNGGGISAFAVQSGKGGKPPAKTGGQPKEYVGDEARYIATLKSDRDRLQKQVQAKDKVISELREENAKLKGKADEAADRKRGRDRERSPPVRGDRHDDKKKVRFEPRKSEKYDTDNEEQRKLPAGKGGKNQPRPIKAMSSDHRRSSRSSPDPDSSFDSRGWTDDEDEH